VRFLLGHRGFLIALFAALTLLPAVANQYTLFIGNMLLLYVILAVGLNLLVGFAGQLAFANAAMYGIGAYGAGLLQVKLGFPYWIAGPCGALIAMGIGTLLAFPALRLSGIYLALATLAFAQTTQWVLLHWEKVTFGAGGFPVPVPDFSPLPISPDYGMYYVSWTVTVGLLIVAWHAMRSRIGRAFIAMRDGEIAAQALGVNLLKYKAMAFALSGFYAGTAGALYCAVLGFVAPEGFDLFQMVLHKAMVVVGGLGSIVGSVLGAALLVYLLEVLREFKATQEIVFGALLLGFVLFQPQGIVTFLKRWLPGWGEPLHYAPGADARWRDRSVGEDVAAELPGADRR
jgi:branched-chain amino acid transport system permease protein